MFMFAFNHDFIRYEIIFDVNLEKATIIKI